MKSSYTRSHLRNHLDESGHMTDNEFDYMRSEYVNDNNDATGKGKFARGAGIIILLLAVLFIIQRFFIPIGPDLSSILRVIPLTGAILVIVIGLGLLTQMRSRRKDSYRNEDVYMADDNLNTSSFEYASEEKSKPPHGDKSGHAKKSQEEGQDPNRAENLRDDADRFGFETSKRWFRSREEKMLFGVCGGLAERFDMDPTIVRALFALAFLSYGFSLVLYIVLAVILPKKPQHSLL